MLATFSCCLKLIIKLMPFFVKPRSHYSRMRPNQAELARMQIRCRDFERNPNSLRMARNIRIPPQWRQRSRSILASNEPNSLRMSPNPLRICFNFLRVRISPNVLNIFKTFGKGRWIGRNESKCSWNVTTTLRFSLNSHAWTHYKEFLLEVHSRCFGSSVTGL